MTAEHNNSHLQGEAANRKLLRVYAIYRVILSGLLLTFFMAGINRQTLGSTNAPLYCYTSLIYLVLSVVTLLLVSARKSSPRLVAIFCIILCDIAAITILMHSSGGIQSGLEFLLIVCVAAGSIFVTGQLSLLLAAIASVCAMLSTLIEIFTEQNSTQSLFHAGLTGALLFITALIFHFFSKKIISEQKKSLQKTQQAHQLQKQNEHIIKRMRTGIIIVDKSDSITLINSAAIQLIGSHALHHSLGIGSHLNTVNHLYRQLYNWIDHPWLRPSPFKVGNIEIQANFIRLDEEEDEQILIFLEDTSMLAQHAQQIKQASLSRLTGSIAHEIRNPIGAISHAAQILQEEPELAPQQTRLVDIIKKQSDRVNELIENILQMSRQSTPKFQKIPLRSWLEKFSTDFTETTGKPLTVEIEGDKTVKGIFDPLQFSQLLTNLLDNAIRYSKEATGEYWAGLHLGIDPDNGHPYLDVKDRGNGIADENVAKIFEPFFTTYHHGSGLGLYISREICILNFATLDYLQDAQSQHFFRIGFSHPDRILPGSYT